MAGGEFAARIGVESVADPAGVAGAQGASDLAVGGDFSLGDFANEIVDLGEKIHEFNESLSDANFDLRYMLLACL